MVSHWQIVKFCWRECESLRKMLEAQKYGVERFTSLPTKKRKIDGREISAYEHQTTFWLVKSGLKLVGIHSHGFWSHDLFSWAHNTGQNVFPNSNHDLLECRKFNEFRQQFINTYYLPRPNTFKMSKLLNSDNPKKLAGLATCAEYTECTVRLIRQPCLWICVWSTGP